jgi:hypothetical protein
MTDKNQLSREKQMRITEISLTVPIVALFATGLYLLYLKTVGVDISDWFFFSSLLVVIVGGFIVRLGLNEVLLKMYGGEFKFKRLVFRWVLMASYFSLLSLASLCFALVFPWETTFWQSFSGALVATAIFVRILLKTRGLFGRLDKGKW